MALVAEALSIDGWCVDRTFLQRGSSESALQSLIPGYSVPLISVCVKGKGARAEILYRWAVYQNARDDSTNLNSQPSACAEVSVKAASIVGCRAFPLCNDVCRTRVYLVLRDAPSVSVKVSSSKNAEGENLAMPAGLRGAFSLRTQHSILFNASCSKVRRMLSPVCMFAPKLPTCRRKRPLQQKPSLASLFCQKRLTTSESNFLKPKQKIATTKGTEYIVQRLATLEQYDEMAKKMKKICMVRAGAVVTASKAPEKRLGMLRVLVCIQGTQTSGWLGVERDILDISDQADLSPVLKPKTLDLMAVAAQAH